MQRITLYTLLYLVMLGINILFSDQVWASGLMLGSFIISTIAYTFSTQKLPPQEYLKYPEASAYRSKRLNIYGYGMLAILVCGSTLFYINTFNNFVSQTILVGILWPLTIIGSYLLAQYNSKVEALYSAYDFVCNRLDNLIDFENFKSVYYGTYNVDKKFPNSGNPDQIMLRETQELIKEFIDGKKNPINPEEVRDLK